MSESIAQSIRLLLVVIDQRTAVLRVVDASSCSSSFDRFVAGANALVSASVLPEREPVSIAGAGAGVGDWCRQLGTPSC